MKKFMTNIKTLAALLMAGAAFTACSSDDNITSEQPANPTGKYTMTVNALKGGDATTRALSLEGKTLNATWATTENVYVKKGSDWATGSLKPQADGATATLKGELSDVIIAAGNTLTLQFPKSGTPVYTGQVGTLADIAANYDYATATVTVDNVDGSGNITVNEPATFTNQQSIVKFTLKNGETLLNAGTVRVQATAYNGYSEIFDIVFTIPDATYTTNGNGVIYLAIPNTSSYFSNLASIYSMSLDAIKSSCKLNITATVGDDTYTYTKSGWPFEDGKYYEITVKMTKQGGAAEGHALSASAVGEIVGSDGKAYAVADKDNLPDGVIAVGMVAYKYDFEPIEGIVIALTDESDNTYNWTNAKLACSGKFIDGFEGYTWKVPTSTDWSSMFKSFGNNGESWTGLNTALVNAGGNVLKSGDWVVSYWAENPVSGVAMYMFVNSDGSTQTYTGEMIESYVRACFKFGGE